MKNSESFAKWLNAELDKRNLSRSEAARRGGISPSMFDKVIGGFAKPGVDFCRGVAKTFRVPLEEVYRRAGLLPPITDEDTRLFESIKARIGLLSPVQRAELDRYLDYLVSSAQVEPGPRGAAPVAADAGAARPKYSSGNSGNR